MMKPYVILIINKLLQQLICNNLFQMEKNTEAEDYQYRIGSIFNRLQTINKNAEQDKLTKFKLTTDLISKFETLAEEITSNHIDKYQQTLDQLTTLQKSIKEHQNRLSNHQELVQANIKNLQQNVRQTVVRFNKQQQIIQNSMKQKIKHYYARLNDEYTKQFKIQGNILNQYKSLVQVEGPALFKQIKQQKLVRQEIQEKIFDQFSEQINQLKDQIKVQSKLRESQEEQLIQLIKSVTVNIHSKIKKEKQLRKQNQQALVKLVDTIIDKIKYEILDPN